MQGKKMIIDVIFTGGTIGSSIKGDYIGPDANTGSLLINRYREDCGSLVMEKNIHFREHHPINILSENIQAGDFTAMINAIREVPEDSAGIILTHGTDTLCYTANLLSLVFADFGLPIILVSALFPLEDARSNGPVNFMAAVEEILKNKRNGVLVSFCNPGEVPKVFPASRTLRPDACTGAFRVWGDDKEQLIKAERRAFSFSGVSDDILVLQARPLLRYDIFSFKAHKPLAVIVELYHSGTVCTEGKGGNLLEFAEYCRENGVPLIVGPVLRRAGVYESAGALKDNCIISYNQSFEMTVVKVMLALGSGADIRDVLDMDYSGEHLNR